MLADLSRGLCHGLRAHARAPGASFRCEFVARGADVLRIDAQTLDVRFSVIGSELWSDDPGFAESTEAFGITGICGSGIIEVVAEMYLAGIVNEDGVIDGGMSHRTDRLFEDGRTWSFLLHDGAQRIVVTQNDIRQIQLAKVLVKLERLDDAQALYKTVLDQPKSDGGHQGDAWFGLGGIEEQRGANAEAKVAYEKAKAAFEGAKGEWKKDIERSEKILR